MIIVKDAAVTERKGEKFGKERYSPPMEGASGVQKAPFTYKQFDTSYMCSLNTQVIK